MLQAVKQSTLEASQVFVESGTPKLYFIALQNSNVGRPNTCLNPLRKYFSLRVHVTLRSKRCVEIAGRDSCPLKQFD